jgi:hypothetical protein
LTSYVVDIGRFHQIRCSSVWPKRGTEEKVMTYFTLLFLCLVHSFSGDSKVPLEAFEKPPHISQFMLPDSQYRPLSFPQSSTDSVVARTIVGDLCRPERRVGLGAPVAAGTSVPKAPINKNHQPDSWEHEVGCAGEPWMPTPSPYFMSSEETSQGKLGRPVPSRLYSTHALRSLCFRQEVGHLVVRSAVYFALSPCEPGGRQSTAMEAKDRSGRPTGGADAFSPRAHLYQVKDVLG